MEVPPELMDLVDLVDLVAFPSLAAKGSPLHHSPRHFSALLSKNVTGHTPWPVLVVLCLAIVSVIGDSSSQADGKVLCRETTEFVDVGGCPRETPCSQSQNASDPSDRSETTLD